MQFEDVGPRESLSTMSRNDLMFSSGIECRNSDPHINNIGLKRFCSTAAAFAVML